MTVEISLKLYLLPPPDLVCVKGSYHINNGEYFHRKQFLSKYLTYAIKRLFLTKDNAFYKFFTCSSRKLDTFSYLTAICSKISFHRNYLQDNIARVPKVTSEYQTCRLEPSSKKVRQWLLHCSMLSLTWRK